MLFFFVILFSFLFSWTLFFLFLSTYFYYLLVLLFFFFKQKTAYEMRISDWSSDVCSSDLGRRGEARGHREPGEGAALQLARRCAPARGRQVRRDGRVAAALDGRADAGTHRPCHRQAHRALPYQRGHRAAPALPRREGKGHGERADADGRRSLLLLRLPAPD